MDLSGSRRLGVITGAVVLVTAMSAPAVAAARTPPTICGPEVDLGPAFYKTCSDVLWDQVPGYSTQPFIEVHNRGIADTTVTATLEHWNPATSSWETDFTSTRTVWSGGSVRLFSGPHAWACGQDGRERARATGDVGTGAWSEVVTPADC